MTPRPSQRRHQTAAMIGGLTVANAMLFQEVASGFDSRIRPLRQIAEESDFSTALVDHWGYIINNVDFYPIFHIAREVLLTLPSNPSVDEALRNLVTCVLQIVQKRAALRHDLMGRIYHRLLLDAKYLGTYYTSVPAATLLLKLALDPDRWPAGRFDFEQLSQMRIGDLACGTGTLLMAASEAVVDAYVFDCVQHGVAPDLERLHKTLLEDVIYGYDVLASAVHLTASTLALKAPETPFYRTNLHVLPLGDAHLRLGSIEFLGSEQVQMSLDFFGTAAAGTAVTGQGQTEALSTMRPTLDLCVMNPPFTRSVGGNLLFGSIPQAARRAMQNSLARLLRSTRASASSTAGLASVFVAVGDKCLTPGGCMALVLPKAVLSGVAWERTRRLLLEGYSVEFVVASHDPERWNFSENTEMSEVLIVAKKHGPGWRPSDAAPAVFVNLHYNPRTDVEALALAQSLKRQSVPRIDSPQGAGEFEYALHGHGMAVSLAQRDLEATPWILPSAFAQRELTTIAFWLLSGVLLLPHSGETCTVPIVRLGELGGLGPDRRDVYDGFELCRTHTQYPAFWGHEADQVRTLALPPNAYLRPLDAARNGRPLRRTADLWPRAGSIMLAERMRLNTQRAPAVRLPSKALSNVWWPFSSYDLSDSQEKALMLWLNSTLGLVSLIARREETQGPWVAFRKPVLQDLLVLDVRQADASTVEHLAAVFDLLAGDELQPIGSLASDATRIAIDEALSHTIGIPDLGVVRELLSREPIVTLRHL